MSRQHATIKPTMAKETELLQVRIDSELKKRIAAVADARGVSTAALVMMAITEAYPEVRTDAPTGTISRAMRYTVDPMEDAFDEEAKRD